MNRNFQSYLIALVVLLSCLSAKAQDPHFSQYFQAPLYTNPALTGQLNGNYRVTALYRSQWQAFGNSFTTASISADTRKDAWGLGVSIIDELSSNNNFGTLNGMVSASYDISAKSNTPHHFIFGVQAGVLYKSYRTGDITTPSQWDPATGGGTGDLGEDFGGLSSIMPDINFGFMWFNGSAKVRVAPFAGAAVFHLLEPNDDFGGGNVKLPRRYMVHGGARIRTDNGLDITPHAQIMYQRMAYNAIIGTNFSYALIDTETRLEGGVSYRVNDAVIPYIGMLYKDFLFGATFDVNVSSLSDVGTFKNAVEFSLTYTNRKNKYRQEYICPRL